MIDPSLYTYLDAPFAVLFDRISRRATSGGTLERLQFSSIPSVEVEEEDKLPTLNTLALELDEEKMGVFQAQEATGGPMILTLVLTTSRKNGWFSLAAAQKRKRGALHWFGLVADAMDIDPDTEQVDLKLKNTLAKPLMHSIRDITMTDLGIQMFIEVALYPRLLCRGGRSTLWGS